MGLETFGFINSLDPSNPLGADDPEQGDNHIRGIKQTLRDTFPNISAAVTSNAAELNLLDGITGALLNEVQRNANGGFAGLDGSARMAAAQLPLAGLFGSSITVGAAAGTRIAIGTTSAQAYDSSNNPSSLRLNGAGGSVILGIDAATSVVSLRSQYTEVAAYNPLGLRLRNMTDGAPALSANQSTYMRFERSDGQTLGLFGYPTSRYMVLRNELSAGGFSLQARDSGGTLRSLFEGVPDGDLTWWGRGRGLLRAEANSLAYYGNANSAGATTSADGQLELRDSAGATTGYFGHVNTITAFLQNSVRSGPIAIRGTSAAGSAVEIANFSPIGDTILRRTGSERLRITAAGITVTGTATVGTPTLSNHATTKAYVDSVVATEGGNYVPASGGTFTGNISLPTGTAGAHAARRDYVQAQVAATLSSAQASAASLYLPLAGGIVSGNITRNGGGGHLFHDSSSLGSGRIRASTSAPSGTPVNGEIWLQYV